MSDFDSLGYAQKLREVGIPQEQAEAEAALIRDQVLALAASKGDLEALGQQLSVKIDRVEERLRAEIKMGDQRVIITLGSTIVGATVILLAAMGLLATWLAG